MSVTTFIRKSILLLLLLCSAIWQTAQAACEFRSDSPVQQAINATMPLLVGNITVGPDMANGTVLYRQTYRFPSQASVVCSDKVYEKRFDYLSTPRPLANWSGTPYSGKVYETGVPGIGAVFWYSGNGFPYVHTSTECADRDICLYALTWDISLIKIGDVAPGVVTGANLPCMSLTLGNQSSPVAAMTACMSGAMNVISGTCTTPDINVDMKEYRVSAFTGVGSTTQWEDATIRLNNCPAFYGTVNDGTNNNWGGDGQSHVGNATANRVGAAIVPNTATLDQANGIFSLRNTENSASGVGIQLAWGNSSSQTLVQLSQEARYVMSLGSSGNFVLPLVARYIQTEDSVTAGEANSAVTFTINYY
jgi:major type 1 subunit fimbrin (pilin)